ncbi:28S ribosomal protein S35, mitochondrial [Zootermopsis nevadensis]|uniref:28S ribosomal protein S35, mitochondrial n=1 Tax=Zootermopsis nevadensis TaxID=136037 RepID=A0A067QHC8_ZOONE|nr:28S ribosomal protein S35, mitochondrial [Zootermopsis nevadensis]
MSAIAISSKYVGGRRDVKNIPAVIHPSVHPFSSDMFNSMSDTEEFRVLDLKQKKQTPFRRKFKKQDVMPPRTTMMPVDQDWGNVWPGPRTFHPAVVPLPVRQGYNEKDAPPGKFGNAELMKIPNFLHLTPPVVTSDYCHSSPDIRNPLARIVTIKVKLGRLPLNKHARDKILRLVGERYNPENDVLTIMTDRCPLRQQNLDYAHYLLTALFHESWKIEPWESEKSEADMEYYDWEASASRKSVMRLLSWSPDQDAVQISADFILSDLTEYKEAISKIMNEGEEEYTLNRYKEEVKKLLSLQDVSSTE